MSASQVTARKVLYLTQTLICRRSFGGGSERVGRGKLIANMGGWDRPMYKFVGWCPLRCWRPCQYPVYFLTPILIMFLRIDLISLEVVANKKWCHEVQHYSLSLFITFCMEAWITWTGCSILMVELAANVAQESDKYGLNWTDSSSHRFPHFTHQPRPK